MMSLLMNECCCVICVCYFCEVFFRYKKNIETSRQKIPSTRKKKRKRNANMSALFKVFTSEQRDVRIEVYKPTLDFEMDKNAFFLGCFIENNFSTREHLCERLNF